MLFFTKINNSILEDLSTKITTKVLENLILQDYITINSISKSEKLNIISKITIVIWQYCLKYINLITNILIALILTAYLFIKFTAPAIIAALFIATLAFIEYIYLKKQSNYQNINYPKSHDELHSTLLTVINSFKEIKLNNKENFFIKKFEKSIKNYARLNKDRNFNGVFHIYFTEISIMLAFGAILAVLYLSSNFDNSIILTSVCTICVIILRLTPVINRAQSCLYSINSNEKIVKELLEFDNKFQKINIYKKTDKIMPFEEIILKNIYFSYNKTDEGLKNISLKIKKGDFIGIAGRSGSYKTTLALIIAGLIKPNAGELLADKTPITENNISKWQNNIAFLGQEFGLIFNKIYENIALKENYDENKIKEFIKNYDLSLDLKENKSINELSSGQKQRIALLSVLYQNKNIIILDEATSSIDALSEEKINEILYGLKGKKTIISIAHRLKTLKNCDKIIFINKDGTIQTDSFENLKKTNEDFKKMYSFSALAN